MSGYCPDCGNTLCVCDEIAKQPDISNCVLIDKVMLQEMQDQINAANELIDYLQEVCEFYSKPMSGRRSIEALEKIREYKSE